MRWVDYIVKALENLDGQAPYASIYDEVKRLRNLDNATLPKTWKANIRGRIEEHCNEVDGYIQGNPHLFFPALGKGKGVWALTVNYQKQLYSKANQKGLIVAYCLAKFNKEAYLEFGYKTEHQSQKEVERHLSIKLGMKQNSTLKQMRDRYDTFFDFRRGYFQQPLPPSFIQTAELLEDLGKTELFSVVKKLFNADEYFDNNFRHIITHAEKSDKKKNKNYNPKQRLKTGKTGEKIFSEYYLKNNYIILNNNKKISGRLNNTTEDQCGYDFEIIANEGKYCIEIKSLSNDSGAISFTSKEWKVANEQKSFFILCLVYNVNSDLEEELVFIDDPASKLDYTERVVPKIQINYEISNKNLKKAT